MSEILVTGSEGCIGKELSKHLDFEGYDVRNEQDILDTEMLDKAVDGKEAVVHLAGIVGAKACHASAESAFEVNVRGTYNVVESCRKHRIPIMLFASTCSVHRAFKGCFNFYNGAKLIGEVISWMNGYNFLRFGTVYGGDLDPTYLIDNMILEAIDKEKITVYGRDVVRPIVHVEDVARAIVFSIDNPPVKFYEVANENLSKGEIATCIEEVFPAETVEVEKGDVSYFGVNKSLTQEGFTFKWTLQKYLRELSEKYTVVETVRP